MLNEKLASLQHGRLSRHRDHLPDHDVGYTLVRRAQDETAGRHHAFQAAFAVHDIEVNDSSARRVLPKPVQGLAHRLSGEEPWKVLMNVLGDQVVQFGSW